jgi:hypothetical protein
MVNAYLAAGDLCPTICFNNGPAYNPYNAARWTFYAPGYYPTFEVDGLIEYVGFSIPTLQGYINSRLAVPSSLSVTQSYVGNASGGTVTYTLTAEQALGASGEIKLWSAIVEDHMTASSEYGYYEGQELMWEPRAWPCGATGQVVAFTGPYPQTVVVTRTYALSPADMNFANLDGVAYVQMSTGTLEVLNASFVDLPDTNTGIFDDGTAPVADSPGLFVGPNPTDGDLNVYSVLPTGTTGTITIFGVDGRITDEFAAGGACTTTLDAPGVYLVRLRTGSGQAVTRTCTVVR